MRTPPLKTKRTDWTVLPTMIRLRKSVVSWPRPDSLLALGSRVEKRNAIAGRPGASFRNLIFMLTLKSPESEVVSPGIASSGENGPTVRALICIRW